MKQKSDYSYPQHGGEGKMLKTKTDINLLKPSPGYCGPGRYLKIQGSEKQSVEKYRMSL